MPNCGKRSRYSLSADYSLFDRHTLNKFTQFCIPVVLKSHTTYVLVMPTIDVSEHLYRQLQSAADGDDLDAAMWKMVGRYQRGNTPGD